MVNQTSSLDLVYQALADPSRRSMVERLSRGPASVSELARPLTMSLPAVVQHLQVLEASGLVTSEKVGRVRTCRFNPDAISLAEGWIVERRAAWEMRLNRLEDLLGDQLDRPAPSGPPAPPYGPTPPGPAASPSDPTTPRSQP